jgi:hypothetical protein
LEVVNYDSALLVKAFDVLYLSVDE